jgi:hypothetical protein
MKKWVLALLLCNPGLAAQAADAYALSAGYGHGTGLVKASTIWHWDQRWFEAGDWHLTGYWEANASLWKSRNADGKLIAEAGFAPIFRLRPNASGATQPYWEAGIGPHLVSRTHVDAQRDLGSALLMAEQVGFGVTFGEKTRYDVGYRLQYLSNWGFKEPDDGITLHQVRLTYLY